MKNHLIIGNPITHSLSPKIHNYWFKKNNIHGIYEKITPRLKEISNIINQIKTGNLHGINVTVPFKQKVIPLLEELSPTVKKTNSVNTIFKKEGKVYGDNTDVFGFSLALKDAGYYINKKKALILGAGGVAPSLVVSLYNLGIGKIYMSNRTDSKLDNLIENFPNIEKIPWGKFEEVDLIINATSVGLKREDNLNLNYDKFGKNKFFYDVIYNPRMTNFLKEAKKNNHKFVNGKMMFIYQAQKAFELWHGFLPKIDGELIKLLEND